MPAAGRNRDALRRWSAALAAGPAVAAVRAGQAVLANGLRRVVPDRKGRLPRLAGAGPAVLVTPVRSGPAGASGSIYVGARYRPLVDRALAARGPAALEAMTARLKGKA